MSTVLKKVLFYLFIIGNISLFFSCERETIGDKIRVGFSQCVSDHDWRKAMNHAMLIQASLSPEIDLTIYEAHKDLQLQIAQIEEMIAQDFDVIIVSPMESEALVPVISKAYDKGIPIVLLDRKINSDKYSAYIGADNLEVGRNAGNFIASSSNNHINVIELKIGDNASPSVERSLGFHEVVRQMPNIDVVASINYTNPSENEIILSRVFDSLENKSIDYLYAFNDLLALESWRIARKKGIENKIKFIGVDGLNGENGGIYLVRNGMLEASILYPTGGAEAIKLASKLAKGKSVQKINLLRTTIIDKRNAEIMKDQFDKINEQQTDIENQITSINELEDKYYFQNNLLKTAVMLSAIILALALYSIYSIFAIRKKNRQLVLTNNKIIVQRNQIEKIAEEVKTSNEAKLNFFTGLSHEFKTPLTLIISSIESLTEIAKNHKVKMMNEVELIYNNSNRLLRLINQLLDYRKLEDRKFTLRASKTNIYDFSKNIAKDFEREAKKNSINFKVNTNNESLDLFIDRNLMDKVYFNLLSNAFKFTPDNGSIEIKIKDSASKNTVGIHFKDTGIGIPEKELAQVFKAFFQGSNNRNNSSGIGLHLSKEFIEMHNGKVVVKSIHGSEFIITLYKGQAHFNENEIITVQDLVDTSIIDFASENLVDEDYLLQEPDQEKEKYSILIIEDNRDLSSFLKNKLQVEYETFVSDGTDAIERAFEAIPDIIICDVNLPNKSGFEICEILKKDLRTSHIPTIILTALGNKESYIKGLESGADLYLTKPFSYSILVQSIKSLLYNREKLRFYYTSNIYKIENLDTFGNIEQTFINKLNTIIGDNLSNSDFSVENLADNLSISRIQLYRKVKAIMGISISDYISTIRLEKAKSLLETTAFTISEIAYKTGFSTPNYFSTAFKNAYDISPGAFRKSI